MNLQIINGCAGTDPGLQTSETNPGWRYYSFRIIFVNSMKSILKKSPKTGNIQSVPRMPIKIQSVHYIDWAVQFIFKNKKNLSSQPGKVCPH